VALGPSVRDQFSVGVGRQVGVSQLPLRPGVGVRGAEAGVGAGRHVVPLDPAAALGAQPQRTHRDGEQGQRLRVPVVLIS
jgi:hypothetical protein